MTATSRRLVGVIGAGVAIFAGFSVYADVGELGRRLAGFQWWAFAAALALALVNYAIRFLRWQLYLRAIRTRVPLGLSLWVFLSGFALSVTPGKVGELIKSYLLRETAAIPVARTVPVVIAERVTDLAALGLLGLLGVAMYRVAPQAVYVGLGTLGLGLLALSSPALMRAGIGAVTAPRLTRRFRDRLLELYTGLAALVRLPKLSWATALAVSAWLAECLGFALIVRAFPGSHVTFGLAVLIYATTTLAGALSFLPGGLLVTEATMTLFLVRASTGLDEPTAVAATMLTRLATLWFAVALGLVALAWLRRTAPGIRNALEAGERPNTPAGDESRGYTPRA